MAKMTEETDVVIYADHNKAARVSMQNRGNRHLGKRDTITKKCILIGKYVIDEKLKLTYTNVDFPQDDCEAILSNTRKRIEEVCDEWPGLQINQPNISVEDYAKKSNNSWDQQSWEPFGNVYFAGILEFADNYYQNICQHIVIPQTKPSSIYNKHNILKLMRLEFRVALFESSVRFDRSKRQPLIPARTLVNAARLRSALSVSSPNESCDIQNAYNTARRNAAQRGKSTIRCAPFFEQVKHILQTQLQQQRRLFGLMDSHDEEDEDEDMFTTTSSSSVSHSQEIDDNGGIDEKGCNYNNPIPRQSTQVQPAPPVVSVQTPHIGGNLRGYRNFLATTPLRARGRTRINFQGMRNRRQPRPLHQQTGPNMHTPFTVLVPSHTAPSDTTTSINRSDSDCMSATRMNYVGVPMPHVMTRNCSIQPISLVNNIHSIADIERQIEEIRKASQRARIYIEFYDTAIAGIEAASIHLQNRLKQLDEQPISAPPLPQVVQAPELMQLPPSLPSVPVNTEDPSPALMFDADDGQSIAGYDGSVAPSLSLHHDTSNAFRMNGFGMNPAYKNWNEMCQDFNFAPNLDHLETASTVFEF